MSSAAVSAPFADAAQSGAPVTTEKSKSSCPLHFGSGSKADKVGISSDKAVEKTTSSVAAECPMGHSASSSASECPLGHSAASSTPSMRKNTALQTPPAEAVDQLSRERVQSTIPSTSGEPFMYPSERQFYGSATAKGHTVDPKDMEMVIAIHNAVNEKAWQEVLRYEKLHEKDCATPKLSHFLGRPGVLSPKAWTLSWFGRSLPFDRHDWHVDRCGTPVRYVVDFYDGKPDPRYPISIHIDCRPEVSVNGMIDRARLWAQGLFF